MREGGHLAKAADIGPERRERVGFTTSGPARYTGGSAATQSHGSLMSGTPWNQP
jgi:hypothetical protein